MSTCNTSLGPLAREEKNARTPISSLSDKDVLEETGPRLGKKKDRGEKKSFTLTFRCNRSVYARPCYDLVTGLRLDLWCGRNALV